MAQTHWEATRAQRRARTLAVVPLAACVVATVPLAALGALIFISAMTTSATDPDYSAEAHGDALGIGAILLIVFGPVAVAALLPTILAFVRGRARWFWIASLVAGCAPLVAAVMIERKAVVLLAQGEAPHVLAFLLVPLAFVAYQWWFSFRGLAGGWRIA